jgi:hypothetical protein
MKDTGGTAFPAQVWDENSLLQHTEGMTLRDYFAAKAMEAKGFTVRPYDTTDEVAKDCYRMADAMLKARQSNG